MASNIRAQALEFDAGGLPYSTRYADVYASRDGALGQARHVFLAGNGLPQAWAGRRQFVILETGFGLGNNFLATWQSWRADPQRPRRLHFVSVELHPLRREDLIGWAAAPSQQAADPGLRALRQELAQRWPLPLSGLHRLEFEDGGVILTLALGDAAALVPRLHLGADAFYLDGFAPDRNPRMWDASLIKALSRLARPGATAASYTCARAVCDALSANGFAVEITPGYASKRQMLRARYCPAWKMRRREPPLAHEGPQQAIVIGAGLAGCSCAYALRRRGWQVTLLERAATVAAGASALPAGLLHPLLSADDNLTSRLSRAGFAFGRDLLGALEPVGGAAPERGAPEAAARSIWSPCGVFHQAEDDAQAAAQRAALAADPWPAAFAQHLEAADVGALLGLAPRRGGIWFPGGAVVASARWCEALLQAAAAGRPIGPASTAGQPVQPAFELVLHAPAVELAREGDQWQVRDAQGRRYRAPVVVLANADGLTALQSLPSVALQRIGGRISLLQAPALGELRAGISGDGYLIPPLLGAAAVGATFEFGPMRAAAPGLGAAAAEVALANELILAAHTANLQRLHQLLAQAPTVRIQGVFAAHRCVAPDRLPLAGQLVDEAQARGAGARLQGAHLSDLPRLPGLYCLAALGSRGLSLAPLLGEHVAAQIGGEPAPIESDLAAALDPGRFLLRQR